MKTSKWTPEELIEEAERQGWKRVDLDRPIALFKNPAGDSEAAIPIDKEFLDYAKCIYAAAKALGITTEKPSDDEIAALAKDYLIVCGDNGLHGCQDVARAIIAWHEESAQAACP